jgi:RNA polymerase sigma-70 factor, ECF subfamily
VLHGVKIVDRVALSENTRNAELSAMMRAAIAGNDLAYTALLKNLSTTLRRTIGRGLAGGWMDRDRAEDVVQDVLLAIHLKRHTWDASLPLMPWVLAIARNKMIDTLRRRGRHQEVPIELIELESDNQQTSIDTFDVARVLEKLSKRNREIVHSIRIEGVPVDAVAARHGMSEVGVRVALHRSLKSLSNIYQERTAAGGHDGAR